MAILTGLALLTTIYAIFWIAPTRLVQVHEQAVLFTGGDPVALAFELGEAHAGVDIRIRDYYADKDSRHIALGDLDAGAHSVDFDGKDDSGLIMSPGMYRFALTGLDGKEIVPAKVHSRVVDTVMGFSSKIFYFHVSSAMVFLISFIGCALLSLVYLIMRTMKGFERMAVAADRIAHSLAEVGVVFSLIVLVTGPIWAKPNWGSFWTWEPRLLFTLLTEFLFIGYLVLRNYSGSDDTAKRMSAGIALIGMPAAYFIHVAVEMWGGNHPQVLQGGGLHGTDIGTTYAIAICSIFFLAGYLTVFRYRTHRLHDRVENLFLDLSELEDRRS
jgi:heme exporter protein C